MRNLFGPLAVLAMAFTVASCGYDTNTKGSFTPGNSAPGGAAGSVGINISIVSGASTLGNQAFEPNPAQVQPGMTVTWINQDNMDHTATSDTGLFDSGNIAPGQSFSWVVPETVNNTNVDYHCKIHPTMQGTLTVATLSPEASPSPSPSASPAPEAT